jgi:ArsR family transcriptional regulator, arsenate/arsenite/antimonite-responsive transcriptional repressor
MVSMPTLPPLLDVSTAPCCTPLAEAPLSEADAAVLAARLKAVADPARLRLVSLVLASPGQEACICDLTEPLGLAQPTVSHHMKVLVEAGLLAREKRGRWAYFRAVPTAFASLAQALQPATTG